MFIQELNLAVYHLINVSEHASPIAIAFGRFIAHDLIYIVVIIFLFGWLLSNTQTKKNIIKAFIFTLVCLCITESISYILNTPRPFVLGLGQNILAHSATGSFPSNHMTIFSSIAFSYYFSSQRELGKLLIAVAWLVAWSRVYVGVHFPFDMLGGFFFAFVVNISGLKLWNMYQNRLMTWVMFIHRKIFMPLINRGLIP